MNQGFVKGIRERAPTLFSRRSFLIIVPPIFAIAYFMGAVRIYSPPVQLEVSARAFPMVVGGALIISAFIVSWEEYRGSTEAPEELAADESPGLAEVMEGEGDEEITSWLDFWVALGAIIVMAIFMDEIGFILAAVGLVAGLSIYFERRHIIRNTVVAIAYAVILYYLFDSVFEIDLPSGPLPW